MTNGQAEPASGQKHESIEGYRRQLMQPPDDYLNASCLKPHHLSIGTTRDTNTTNKNKIKQASGEPVICSTVNNLLFQLGTTCKISAPNKL